MLAFLLNVSERCQQRWLVIKCLELIGILLNDKQITLLLIQQNPEDTFLVIMPKFPNSVEIQNKLRIIMNKILQLCEPETILAVL